MCTFRRGQLKSKFVLWECGHRDAFFLCEAPSFLNVGLHLQKANLHVGLRHLLSPQGPRGLGITGFPHLLQPLVAVYQPHVSSAASLGACVPSIEVKGPWEELQEERQTQSSTAPSFSHKQGKGGHVLRGNLVSLPASEFLCQKSTSPPNTPQGNRAGRLGHGHEHKL